MSGARGNGKLIDGVDEFQPHDEGGRGAAGGGQ